MFCALRILFFFSVTSATGLLGLKKMSQKFMVVVKLSGLDYSMENIFKVFTDALQLSICILDTKWRLALLPKVPGPMYSESL